MKAILIDFIHLHGSGVHLQVLQVASQLKRSLSCLTYYFYTRPGTVLFLHLCSLRNSSLLLFGAGSAAAGGGDRTGDPSLLDLD